jgi:hypothetical protein
MVILVLIVGAFLIPLCLYAYASSPLAWGMIRDGTIRVRGGAYRAYREAPQIRWIEGRAPAVVRVAAFTGFCLGQAVIPGIPCALGGALVACMEWEQPRLHAFMVGLVLFAPTGILVATHVLGAGLALLQRAPHAAERARTAASWELGHNIVLLLYLGVLFSLGVPDPDGLLCCGITLVLCVLAIVHACLLFVAAADLDAYDAAARETSPASIQPDPSPGGAASIAP